MEKIMRIRVKNSKLVAVLYSITVIFCLAFGIRFSINSITAFANEGAELTTFETTVAQSGKTGGVDMQSESDTFTMDSVLSECKRMTDSDVIGVINGVTYTLKNNT